MNKGLLVPVNPIRWCRNDEKVQNRPVMIFTRPSSGHSITDPIRRVNRSYLKLGTVYLRERMTVMV